MNQLSTNAVETFLTRYGWKFTKSTRDVILTGWTSDLRSYPLRIIVDEAFLTLQVQPFLKMEIDLSAFPEVATQLLELNYHSLLVKVSVDDIGDIVLSTSLLREDLSFEDFSAVLGVLAHYADQIFDEMDQILEMHPEFSWLASEGGKI